MNTPYSFLVVYSHPNGTGSVEVAREKQTIDNYEELREIRKLIEQREGIKDAVIVNVQSFPIVGSLSSDEVNS